LDGLEGAGGLLVAHKHLGGEVSVSGFIERIRVGVDCVAGTVGQSLEIVGVKLREHSISKRQVVRKLVGVGAVASAHVHVEGASRVDLDLRVVPV